MTRKSKSQRVNRQKKQRKDYYKKLSLCVIKCFLWLLIAAWVLAIFVISNIEKNYIGSESPIYEVEGVCTEVRHEVRSGYSRRGGSTKYSVVVLTVNGENYTLAKNTTEHVVYNGADRFEEFKKQWTGKELYIQYTHEEKRNIAAIRTADSQNVYLTLEETAKLYRSGTIGIAWILFVLFLIFLIASIIWFLLFKPKPPYFMQKRKEEIKKTKEKIKSE